MMFVIRTLDFSIFFCHRVCNRMHTCKVFRRFSCFSIPLRPNRHWKEDDGHNAGQEYFSAILKERRIMFQNQTLYLVTCVALVFLVVVSLFVLGIPLLLPHKETMRTLLY